MIKNHILKCTVILFTLPYFFINIASAQVNIERLRKTALDSGFQGNFSVKFGLLSGNSSVQTFTGELRLDYTKNPYHVFLISNAKRGKNDSRLFQNKGFIHLRAKRTITEFYSIETFAQEEFNDFTRLEERNLFGGGVRFKAFSIHAEKKKKVNLLVNVGVGFMWENENYKDGIEETNILRSSNYISVNWKVKERLRLAATGYYQTDVSRTADYRMLFNGSLGFNITKRLLFTINLNYRYDSEPVQKVKNFDAEITNGIKYLF